MGRSLRVPRAWRSRPKQTRRCARLSSPRSDQFPKRHDANVRVVQVVSGDVTRPDVRSERRRRVPRNPNTVRHLLRPRPPRKPCVTLGLAVARPNPDAPRPAAPGLTPSPVGPARSHQNPARGAPGGGGSVFKRRRGSVGQRPPPRSVPLTHIVSECSRSSRFSSRFSVFKVAHIYARRFPSLPLFNESFSCHLEIKPNDTLFFNLSGIRHF